MNSLRALSLLRTYAHQTITKNVVRYKRTLWKPDPGVHGQKQIFLREELPSLEDDDFDELESDLMSVNVSHRQHERELAARKEQEKLYIRKKYFKQKLPHFLTWGEMEQIRNLHSKDPEKWSIEKLSEGFPAPPDVIAKIATSNWTKKTTARIKNHDKTVQENWKKFYAGSFKDLPEDLVAHLKKFSNRTEINHPFTKPPETSNIVENKYRGEFSEIITSYERLKNKTQESKSEVLQIESKEATKFKSPPKLETYILNKSRSKNVTLSELENKVVKAAASGKELSEEEKHILSSVNKSEDTQIIDLEQDFSIDKYAKTTQITTQKKIARDYTHLIYPERINIPKSKRKRGCTYKLNDCYYNHDGTFLYRVPGMT